MEKGNVNNVNKELKKCPVDGMPCPSGCKCRQCGKYVEWLTSELYDIFNCRD